MTDETQQNQQQSVDQAQPDQAQPDPAKPRRKRDDAIPPEAAQAIRAIVRDELKHLATVLTEPAPDDGAILHEFKAKIRASLVAAGHVDGEG